MQIIRIDKTQGELVFELFDKYRVFYKQPSDPALAKKFILQRLDNNESVIYVTLAGDIGKQKPVGFTQLYPNYSSVRAVKNWVLNDLYVEAEFRKQGIGKNLIKSAIQFAKKDSVTFLELSTATDNYTAQSLYEQIGFVKQQPDNDFYTYRINLK
ncbi:MAG: GNAT family N-acetyltransferase [Ginsengibacter sp.]